MDCFVARAPRNDGETHFRILAARCARGMLKNFAQKRAWGMPGARRTHSLAWEKIDHTSVVTTGTPRSPGIPARNGFNGFLRALPGDEFVLSPSPAD